MSFGSNNENKSDYEAKELLLKANQNQELMTEIKKELKPWCLTISTQSIVDYGEEWFEADNIVPLEDCIQQLITLGCVYHDNDLFSMYTILHSTDRNNTYKEYLYEILDEVFETLSMRHVSEDSPESLGWWYKSLHSLFKE